MTLPNVVSQDQWHAARIDLLKEEKELTHARDRLSTKRRELPMVRVEKDYVFTDMSGEHGLADLFEGERQLIVQHFMFDPSWDEGCPSCTAGSDEISAGLLRHLRARQTNLVVVSRAPIEKLERYKATRGWTFPWYSSFGSDFNYDFHVSLDATVAPIEWNYRTADELVANGMEWITEDATEQPGYSVFLRVGDDIFHTYSTYARGTEQLGGSYYFLDMTALGRQEEWEEPKGRAESARAAQPDFAE
jgi:predicted dithiol-disulfide oxidoreductase (DUF899 family)